MSPTYDFTCAEGHTTEKRVCIETTSIPCPDCGLPAKREAVYRDQCIFGETVAQHQRRAEVPRDERRYGEHLALFQEAASEAQHAAHKAEERTGKLVKVPNYYKRGLRKAGRIRAGLEAPLTGRA